MPYLRWVSYSVQHCTECEMSCLLTRRCSVVQYWEGDGYSVVACSVGQCWQRGSSWSSKTTKWTSDWQGPVRRISINISVSITSQTLLASKLQWCLPFFSALSLPWKMVGTVSWSKTLCMSHDRTYGVIPWLDVIHTVGWQYPSLTFTLNRWFDINRIFRFTGVCLVLFCYIWFFSPKLSDWLQNDLLSVEWSLKLNSVNRDQVCSIEVLWWKS